MELLNIKINNNLKKTIETISNNTFNLNDIDKKKIGYYNIYHKKWIKKNNKYIDVVNKIIDEINLNSLEKINIDDILYIGYIYSFPNCDNQTFHYDYSNKSETYFIPLTDLTDKNGTEYLSFKDPLKNISNFNILNNINNKYSSKNDIVKYLSENKINENEYDFKIYNTNAYSLYKLPKNIFHRGKINETNKIRIILQLVIIKDKEYINNIDVSELISDAELDDSFSLKNNTYFISFNEENFDKTPKRTIYFNFCK